MSNRVLVTAVKVHAGAAESTRGSPRALRYPLAELIAVAVSAVLVGASSVTAIADRLHDLDDIARARLDSWRDAPATITMWRC